MPLWLAASLLTAFGLSAVAPTAEAAQLTIERRVVEDEDEEMAPCLEAIEGQNWAGVIEVCAALLEDRGEENEKWGEGAYETTIQNVDYAYRMLCEGAAQSQDWAAAVDNCGPAAERYPDAFQFHLYLGIGYQSTSRLPEAVTAFRAFLEGMEADPAMAAQLGQQVVFAKSSLANALQGTGDSAGAIPLLREVATANPQDAEVHQRLGLLLLEEGDLEGADEALAIAVELDPALGAQLATRFFRDGANSFNAQDYEEARGRLIQYLSAQPDGEYATDAHYMVAEIAIRSDENSLAMTHYRSFLERAPDDPRAADVNFRLGEYHFNRRECNAAERYYRRYIRLQPRGENAAYVNDIILDFEDGICEPGD